MQLRVPGTESCRASSAGRETRFWDISYQAGTGSDRYLVQGVILKHQEDSHVGVHCEIFYSGVWQAWLSLLPGDLGDWKCCYC